MSTSIPTVRHIAHFANQVGQVGLPQALRNLGIGDVVGRPAEQVLGVLTDYFCPHGGTIDEAIARDAWEKTIEAVIDQGITDIATLTPEQWQGIIADFITNSIETKVINDIGTEINRLPTDVTAINQLQAELHTTIRGAVDDAIGNSLGAGQMLSQTNIDSITRDIYEGAFAFMSELTSEETSNE